MSIMSINRIMTLREELEAECIDLTGLSEIEEAFKQIPDSEIRDKRENAMASDMLDELEAQVSPFEWDIYNYVYQNYGKSEANSPSWDIGALANYLER